jgi:hypothetical protein
MKKKTKSKKLNTQKEVSSPAAIRTLVVLAVLGLLAALLMRVDIQGPTVGKAAPEIKGKVQDGRTVKLSDFKGKVVLLDFWGDW